MSAFTKSLLRWALLITAAVLPAAAQTANCQKQLFEPTNLIGSDPLAPQVRYWIRIKFTSKPGHGTMSGRLFIDPDIQTGNYDIYQGPTNLNPKKLYSNLDLTETNQFLTELCGADFVSGLSTNGPRKTTRLAAAAPLPSGQASQDFFVADLNGDGIADYISLGSRTVAVSLRGPDGFVTSVAEYPVGPGASSGLIADFNGDGKLDLAITNQGRIPNFGQATSGTLSILLGTGDGTFQPAVNFPVDGLPDSLAVADFNADGKLDVATVGSTLSPNTVMVLYGNGNGTFGRPDSTWELGRARSLWRISTTTACPTWPHSIFSPRMSPY